MRTSVPKGTGLASQEGTGILRWRAGGEMKVTALSGVWVCAMDGVGRRLER